MLKSAEGFSSRWVCVVTSLDGAAEMVSMGAYQPIKLVWPAKEIQIFSFTDN